METSAPFTGYDMAESGRIEVASISGEIPFADHPPVRARHRLYRGADMADMTEAHLLAVRSPQEATGVLNIAGPYPWQAEDRRQLRHDPATLITQRIPEVATGFGRLGWALPMSIDRVYVSARASAVLGYRPRHGVTAPLTEVHTSG